MSKTTTELELQAVVGYDYEYLGDASVKQVAREVDHHGLPFEDGARKLRGWAKDARNEYYCEAQEYARFDADH